MTGVQTCALPIYKTLLNVAIKGDKFTPDDIIKKSSTKTISKYDYKDTSTYTSETDLGKLYHLYNNPSYKNERDYMSLKVVGVLRSKEDTYLDLMPASIGYNTSLKDFFVADSGVSSVNNNFKNNWYIPRTEEAWNNFVQLLKDIQKGSITADSKNIYSLVDSVFNCESIFSKDTTPSCETYVKQAGRFGTNFPVNKDVALGDFDKLSNDEKIKLFSTVNSNLINYIVYYLGYSTLTSIVIFPTSLTTKADIIKKLDFYNQGKVDSEQIL